MQQYSTAGSTRDVLCCLAMHPAAAPWRVTTSQKHEQKLSCDMHRMTPDVHQDDVQVAVWTILLAAAGCWLLATAAAAGRLQWLTSGPAMGLRMTTTGLVAGSSNCCRVGAAASSIACGLMSQSSSLQFTTLVRCDVVCTMLWHAQAYAIISLKRYHMSPGPDRARTVHANVLPGTDARHTLAHLCCFASAAILASACACGVRCSTVLSAFTPRLASLLTDSMTFCFCLSGTSSATFATASTSMVL
jgi:hypothetical protein